MESRTSTYHACSRHVKITLDGTEFRPGSNFLPQPLLFSTIIRQSVCSTSCLSAFNCNYALYPCSLTRRPSVTQPDRFFCYAHIRGNNKTRSDCDPERQNNSRLPRGAPTSPDDVTLPGRRLLFGARSTIGESYPEALYGFGVRQAPGAFATVPGLPFIIVCTRLISAPRVASRVTYP